MFSEPGGRDRDEDVDGGFSGEAGHGGAADVVDGCVGDWGGVVGGGEEVVGEVCGDGGEGGGVGWGVGVEGDLHCE